MGPGVSAFASPGGMALAAAAAGAGGGRGSGPDHREVRYQDGVLSMINTLRQLALGGPRTWDYQTYQQVGGGTDHGTVATSSSSSIPAVFSISSHLGLWGA